MKFRQKYTLLPFTTKDGTVIYYVRYHDPRTGRRTKVSSGETTKGRAHTFAENLLGESSGQALRLEDYARDFFKWGTCPWIRRQHAKGHSFSQYQAKTRRVHNPREKANLPIEKNHFCGHDRNRSCGTPPPTPSWRSLAGSVSVFRGRHTSQETVEKGGARAICPGRPPRAAVDNPRNTEGRRKQYGTATHPDCSVRPPACVLPLGHGRFQMHRSESCYYLTALHGGKMRSSRSILEAVALRSRKGSILIPVKSFQ